ncbi:hypothetical protein Raf01_96670 [Rugosimonospora africana]|uniref:Uncharacterized protein n=1 Tax=Rugosimonospora africana TaxID=556532 RepID=A0A8J3R1Y5_9ACTN|nr:hypothetical protein Raf01_96670 [Rugosimonospora africana]
MSERNVPTRPLSTSAWTPERIRALGTVTTVPIAAAIFGLSRSVAYDLVKTGQFPGNRATVRHPGTGSR